LQQQQQLTDPATVVSLAVQQQEQWLAVLLRPRQLALPRAVTQGSGCWQITLHSCNLSAAAETLP
jgi:hypothetical protein